MAGARNSSKSPPCGIDAKQKQCLNQIRLSAEKRKNLVCYYVSNKNNMVGKFYFDSLLADLINNFENVSILRHKRILP